MLRQFIRGVVHENSNGKIQSDVASSTSNSEESYTKQTEGAGTTESRINGPEQPMTRYAIGDIHGGVKTLQALLNIINLRRQDRLYLLGDYVDRGSDSKGALDTIIELKNAKYDVRPLLGNHDQMFLNAINGDTSEDTSIYIKLWGLHTLVSFDEMFACDVPKVYRVLLESMPLIYVEDDYVLVHAGLDMSKDDPIRQTSAYDMLWTEQVSVDSIKLGGRSLVVGHRIQHIDNIYVSLNTNYVRLDNGAFSGMLPDYGNLIALNLDTNELTLQPWLDGKSEE
jgi:serine/threonine protein phosphatase 1